MTILKILSSTINTYIAYNHWFQLDVRGYSSHSKREWNTVSGHMQRSQHSEFVRLLKHDRLQANMNTHNIVAVIYI